MTRNDDVIERLRKYIPKIEKAFERERLLRKTGAAPDPAPAPMESEASSQDIEKYRQSCTGKEDGGSRGASFRGLRAMMQDRDAQPCPASVLERRKSTRASNRRPWRRKRRTRSSP